MFKSILSQLWSAVNTDGLTLEAAIAKIIPGADPAFWRPRVVNYDPDAPRPKRKRRRTTRRRSRKMLRATMPKGPSAFVQAEERGKATLELVERVNGDEDDEPGRAILVNACGVFYGVVEV